MPAAGGSAAVPGLPLPTLCASPDVNALNFCRFSLLAPLGRAALLAVPNLVESAFVRRRRPYSRAVQLDGR